jgi:mxaK protein
MSGVIKKSSAAMIRQSLGVSAGRRNDALLRRAFDHIERSELEPANPFVNLAKREYRRALQLAPDYWDAKFNFDVAARLVRDFPDFERNSGDELSADPKKLWTDIPGKPKGLP